MIIQKVALSVNSMINIFTAVPNDMKVNFRSSGPGDYIYMAIPYPPSAIPFTVTLGATNLTRVYNIDSVSSSTYFYDTTTEHLYLLYQENTVGQNFNDKWVYKCKTYVVTTYRISCTIIAAQHSQLKPAVILAFLLKQLFHLYQHLADLRKPIELIYSDAKWFLLMLLQKVRTCTFLS